MRILAMMSGGVDSSVTAFLLKKAGHDVTGLTMRLYDAKEEGPGCCGGSRDAGIAKEAARVLNIPHRTLDETAEFKNLVMDRFTDSYQNGETPNPCVECNRSMKFGRILGLAKSWGFDAVATGHYAKIARRKTQGVRNEEWGLFKAKDKKKDQSYFLYMLQQEQLKRILFPLAELEKNEVRKIAEEAGLPNAAKEESQDICFVSALGGDYRALVGASGAGELVETSTGRVLGRHEGFARFTVGQREGLGVAVGRPLYVTSIDPKTCRVYVGEPKDLDKNEIQVEELSWVNPKADEEAVQCRIKIRYRSPEADCTVEPAENGRVRVIFDRPQRAPSPGQFAVFYGGDEVLGGGKICP